MLTRIPIEKTRFNNSTLWPSKGSRNFCYNAHISIIFQVNLQRSLSFGTSGGSTPDSKIVRISIDENSGGAGFHLNDHLKPKKFAHSGFILDGWSREWSSGAIAKEYSVNISASNDKANVLMTTPENNLNKEYQFRDSSILELGVAGGLEGPKSMLQASASYKQQRMIIFETHDYKMERLTIGAQNIQFKFSREQYPLASSLINRHTDAIWIDDVFPADLNRVNAMGYASFVPKLDVVYSALPSVSGTTDFTVETSVQIMPLYHARYLHWYLLGAHYSYNGEEFDRAGNTFTLKNTFQVDWDHAVFTGGRPVNLQPAAFVSKCVEIDNEFNVTLNDGDLSSGAQSFIYDDLGRYVSVKNLKMCLDGANLDRLQRCSSSLTQRWKWQKGTDNLINEFSKKKLGADTSTGKLGLYDGNTGTINTTIKTAFTKLFSHV